MDIAILLGSLFIFFAIGVPIAYSLGLAAIAGAMWIGIPLEAVVLQISDGCSQITMPAIPLFALARAIRAAGGRARRLAPLANAPVPVFLIRVGLSVAH